MAVASPSNVLAPFAGTVIALAEGPVRAGAAVVVLEAMKMGSSCSL
ncbi:MAG: hypothetical protein WBP81_24615 [Solirubrobacteraceae bacterium]